MKSLAAFDWAARQIQGPPDIYFRRRTPPGVTRSWRAHENPISWRALQDVSLDIPAGMFGLLGPNGAGKSTLMRTIATLQQPDSGSIRLGEIDVLTQPQDVRKILGARSRSAPVSTG